MNDKTAHNTALNLRHLLNALADLREHVTDMYLQLRASLGADATFIHDWADFHRLQRDELAGDELEGDYLGNEVLNFCYREYKDYIWHYRSQCFRITPFRLTSGDAGYQFHYGDRSTMITFSQVAPDAVDTECSLWEAIVARMYGIADGYLSAVDQQLSNPDVLKRAVQDGRLKKAPQSPQNLADDHEYREQVESVLNRLHTGKDETLEHKTGYDVPESAVKVPDGAEEAVPGMSYDDVWDVGDPESPKEPAREEYRKEEPEPEEYPKRKVVAGGDKEYYGG